MIEAGTPADREACIRLWLDAMAARDGRPAPRGTVERCAAKFAHPVVSFPVARDMADQRGAAADAGELLAGFALVTGPGTGAQTDPPDAAYLAMLAVAPSHQGAGLGSLLLDQATRDARTAGHRALVLHVLASNTAAVRLYTSRGWVAHGPAHAHPLTGDRSQTYTLALGRP